MKIKSLKAAGIGPASACGFDFFEDINVITGLNGSGKTTLLKLIWYIISANVERLIPEISFSEIDLVTDSYAVTLAKKENVVDWSFCKNGEEKQCDQYDIVEPSHPESGAEKLNRLIVTAKTRSLFFPTFRRIEGGYSMTPTDHSRTYNAHRDEWVTYRYGVDQGNIQTELQRLSQRVSVEEHRLICSISTDDIVSLLTSQYARASGIVNESYRRLSTDIIEKVKGVESGNAGNEQALVILEEIKKAAETVNTKRERVMLPFAVLSDLTLQIFRHKGIQVKGVKLGDAKAAIDSALLSAGEKQMLSFLCYNAFYSDCVIFIDEPELSLHPDWQRKLFPTLLAQQSKNQFIIATHSPFIYSKYEDRELALNENKGE